MKLNETVYHIADHRSIFVEVLLHQRHLASIAPGDEATVLVTGGAVCRGRVRTARTPGPADIDNGNALKLAGDMQQVRVVIDLEPGAAGADLVGRHARVLITPHNAGVPSRLVAALFAWTGR